MGFGKAWSCSFTFLLLRTVQRFVFELFAASALLVWLDQTQSKGDIASKCHKTYKLFLKSHNSFSDFFIFFLYPRSHSSRGSNFYRTLLKLKVVLLIPVPGSSAWENLCCTSSVYLCQGGNKCIHMKRLKYERERFYWTVSERYISEEPQSNYVTICLQPS